MRSEKFIFALFVLAGSIQSIEMQIESFFVATLGDCTMTKAFFGLTYNSLAEQAKLKLANCLVKLHTDTDKITYSLNNASLGIMQSQFFNPFLPTIVLYHGYTGDSEGAFMVQLAKDIKPLGKANILSFDHSALTRTNYFVATTNSAYAGEAMGRVLADMYSRGARNFHLIGISLGSQISAFTAKEFNKITGVKIDRITGLDPAGPCFIKVADDEKLTKDDAIFVDVIHTNMGSMGIIDPVGHVDFYPNGGIWMPGCWDTLSSHIRSILYFTESVKNENAFRAVSCADWNTFNAKGCINNTKISMGYALQNNVPHGKYFLKTSYQSMYGLGEAGVV